MISIAINPTGDPKKTPKRLRITHTVDVLSPGEPLRIGAISRHPHHGFVYIESGALDVNGRLSNHWTFRRVNADGTLVPKRFSEYGWV